MAAPLTFDGFDRPAMAEAEGGIDDTEAMEAKPAQKTTNNFLISATVAAMVPGSTSGRPKRPSAALRKKSNAKVTKNVGLFDPIKEKR